MRRLAFGVFQFVVHGDVVVVLGQVEGFGGASVWSSASISGAGVLGRCRVPGRYPGPDPGLVGRSGVVGFGWRVL
jgi:hypothetical protein